ncbi:MAG: cell division protein FtsZ [Flavipsychrobacter sp.]
MIHFEIPKNQSSIIKVIGVGGGGSNAVNYMHSLGIEGVDFVVCNTDSQALALSPIPNKIQLGPHLTQGLGAGANPEIGKQAGEESMEDITKILKVNTRMAFITAGMGGGTGTGGAPVVAKICRELGILTVGIVTTPFSYEGKKRMSQAQAGIDRLREHVDTILIISNDKLRQQFGNLPFTQAFAKADDVLATAAKCITDVITTTGQINVDFADVCTVMKSGGVAILGSATVAGENRALHAVEEALSSPLLNDNDIRGAKWILLNITSAAGDHEHTMDEAEAIQAFVQKQAGEGCDVILGMGHDPNLDDNIAVTVIATGFNHKEISGDVEFPMEKEDKIVMTLDGTPQEAVDSKPEATEQSDNATVTSMSPVLVEAKQERKPLAINPTPAFPKRQEEHNEEERISLTLNTESDEEVANISLQQKQQEEEKEEKDVIEPVAEEKSSTIELFIKNEEEERQSVASNESYSARRELTEAELEEKRNFEAQKKALEERAERLRRMSFNIDSVESSDDIEAVPAYVRRNVEIDNTVASSETFLSGYSVKADDENGKDKGDIGTINTFLDGKRPD